MHFRRCPPAGIGHENHLGGAGQERYRQQGTVGPQRRAALAVLAAPPIETGRQAPPVRPHVDVHKENIDRPGRPAVHPGQKLLRVQLGPDWEHLNERSEPLRVEPVLVVDVRYAHASRHGHGNPSSPG